MDEERLLTHLKKIEQRYEELELLLVRPEVISNKNQYHQYAKEMSKLSDLVFLSRDYKKAKAEIAKLELTLKEKHDDEFLSLVRSEIKDLKTNSKESFKKIKEKLQGADARADKDTIIEVRAGTGGQEASLFAADLYRMYIKYAQKCGWRTEMLSSHPTELGGFKEVVFSVRGKQVYQHLKWESGVHRTSRYAGHAIGGGRQAARWRCAALDVLSSDPARPGPSFRIAPRESFTHSTRSTPL